MTTIDRLIEDELPPPKVTDSPERIYLQYGDIDIDCTHDECEEVSWCNEPVYDSDIAYVRADIADTLRDKVRELEVEVETLRLYGNKDCTAMADEALLNRSNTHADK